MPNPREITTFVYACFIRT